MLQIRVGEFEKLTGTYNGKLYNFDNIEVRSAGNRDADSDDVSGMSASKQRKAAAENDFEGFLRGVPTSILINKNGEEFARIVGSIDFEDVEFVNWLSLFN